MPRHSYSVAHMNLFISMILSSVSLRCASRIMRIFCTALHYASTPIPSWYTSRIWLLKIGYYKLTREKEFADDWIWIVDHSVQWGAEKCLLILGIRKKDLPKDEKLFLGKGLLIISVGFNIFFCWVYFMNVGNFRNSSPSGGEFDYSSSFMPH